MECCEIYVSNTELKRGISLLFCNVKEFTSFSYELGVNFMILITETHIMIYE